MAYKLQGLEEYERMLSRVESMTRKDEVAGAVIYSGADVVADQIRKSIEALPVVDSRVRGSERRKITGVTKLQKQGLLQGFGITKMRRKNGIYDVKLGFDGYNAVKTKSHPGGQPNALIARAVNSGTSFRTKTRFVDKASKEAKPGAENAMKDTFDRELVKAVEG